MTVQENTDIVKQAHMAFAQGDLDAVLDYCAEDIDWELYGPADIPTTGNRYGKDEVREFFAKVNQLWDNECFQIQQFVAQKDSVVVLGEAAWRSKITACTVNLHFAQVIKVKNGKIAHFRELTDTAAILKAMVA